MANFRNVIQNTRNSNSDFVTRVALRAENSLNIAYIEKATKKTCSVSGQGHVGRHSVGALDKWSLGEVGNFCALGLVILHCIQDGVGDTFQLRYRWP